MAFNASRAGDTVPVNPGSYAELVKVLSKQKLMIMSCDTTMPPRVQGFEISHGGGIGGDAWLWELKGDDFVFSHWSKTNKELRSKRKDYLAKFRRFKEAPCYQP